MRCPCGEELAIAAGGSAACPRCGRCFAGVAAAADETTPLSAAAAPPAEARPARLGGYRVLERVGAGAMGTVYRGQDEGLDRPVALKVLDSQRTRDASFLDRFRREARAMARVSHPNLAHVYAIGEEDGRHYFAMEFLGGGSLTDLVRRGDPLEPAEAAALALQAARGLDAALRDGGVVHRDVKPSNLLLSHDGTLKVTDFGLAKVTAPSGDASLTAEGTVLGTPYYMAPEQARGEAADHRSDIYALGCTLYHLLVGDPPYPAPTPMAAMMRHATDPVPRAAERRPDLPPAFDRVLGRMLAKDPALRHPDYAALIADLEGLARLRTVEVPLDCQPLAPWVHRPSYRLMAPVTLLKPAGLARRVAASLIDSLVLLPLSLLDQVISAALRPPPYLAWTTTGLADVVVFVAYYVGLHLRYGRTLGKMALGIQVFSRDGGYAGPRAVLVRFLPSYALYYVPAFAILPGSFAGEDWGPTEVAAVALTLGAFVVTAATTASIALQADCRGLHDRVAGTRVVHRQIRREVALEVLGGREGPDPVLAAVLALVPGGGHFYLGRWARAAALLVFLLAVMPVGFAILAVNDAPRPSQWAFVALYLATWAVGIIDAWRLARAARPR
ncbi:MAG: protein kinase [Planctomycetes bacterium]|nr:protein kinase [Planctomycetota bacterium]